MKSVLKDVRRSRIIMTKEIGKCIQQVRKQNKNSPHGLYNKETDEIIFQFHSDFNNPINSIIYYCGDIQYALDHTSKLTNASKYLDEKTLELLSVPNNLEIEIIINQYPKTPYNHRPPSDEFIINVYKPREEIFSKTTKVGKLKETAIIKE